ncbi:helix-turn-helix transcriptional regulator [Escherichia coli]|nr:helix-turn-helix transcriptional regulator [Escherichia coli]
MVKIRKVQYKILRIYAETAKILFIFTEKHLAYYAILYFRSVLYGKVWGIVRMTLQNRVIISVIAFAEHLLESESRSDISQLVRYSGYSRRHLQRLFRNKTGMSVGDYIRRRRLTRAAILVRLTGYPLHGIAISVGFNSQPSFNREFRKRFGCSPGVYLNRPGWDLSLLTPRVETGTVQYSTGKCVREWRDVRVRKFISEGHIPVTHESRHYARVLDTVFSAAREKTEEVTVVSGTKPVNTGYHIITYLVCDDGETTLSFSGREYLKFRFRTSRENHLQNICTLYMNVLTNKKYMPADDVHTEIFSYRQGELWCELFIPLQTRDGKSVLC